MGDLARHLPALSHASRWTAPCAPRTKRQNDDASPTVTRPDRHVSHSLGQPGPGTRRGQPSLGRRRRKPARTSWSCGRADVQLGSWSRRRLAPPATAALDHVLVVWLICRECRLRPGEGLLHLAPYGGKTSSSRIGAVHRPASEIEDARAPFHGGGIAQDDVDLVAVDS
jgi:hypothetical protein